MITMEKLKDFGANVEEGLERCMGREDFYLSLVKKAAQDQRLPLLEEQLAAKDLTAAFETAHALKGIFANLALEPLTKPVSEMTELLRAGTDTDYSGLLGETKAQFEKLNGLQD